MIAAIRLRSAEALTLHLTLTLEGTQHVIALRRSPRAKRMTLRLRNASRDFVLTVPQTVTSAMARDFLERQRGWMIERLRRLPARVMLTPDAIIPLRGVAHRVVHRPEGLRDVTIEAARHGEGPTMNLCVSGPLAQVPRALLAYFKREAQRDLAAAVRFHAGKIGKTVKRVTIRDTTSRWGSCSSTGNLNFSWRLVLAPAYVLDYLAAHEVAHLLHMDHSPRFWKLANQLSGDVARAEAWLKAQGARLHQIG
ncbi:MAG: M48 family metallopeptidase [Hyphomicrobiales bacterium]|nr:M48 family metallopeptidase [Hyphomicrobiales bacterium]